MARSQAVGAKTIKKILLQKTIKQGSLNKKEIKDFFEKLKINRVILVLGIL